MGTVLCQHVTPLFYKNRAGIPIQCGCGFFVADRDSQYLVSAAHVFDEIGRGNQLFYPIGNGLNRELSGRALLTPLNGKPRASDRLDVGVLKLEGPALPPYPATGKRSLPVAALMRNALPRENKQYMLVGFPETKSRANPVARELKSQPYSYTNVSAPSSIYAACAVNERTHIAVLFRRGRSVAQDGSMLSFPSPRGMSGSPLWLLHDQVGDNDLKQTPVVGVFIEYAKPHNSMIATDAATVFEMILAHER
jgi:hypothetical protein